MSLREQMLRSLPFSPSELDMLIWSAGLRYKTYYIEKRQAGKYRQVSQPTPEVKLLQRWLIKNFFHKLPIHDSACAYRNGVGLAKNVLPHAGNRFLLKIDFSNFFPSIKSAHFVEFMRRHGYNDADIDVARMICFRRERSELFLAIGAPSSPLISNVMMYALDCSIAIAAKELGVVYSRYADDLSFSCNSPNILKRIEQLLPGMIDNHSITPLKINSEKTVHASKKNGRNITGLNITPDGNLSVGHDRKRLLRSQIHHYITGRMQADEVESLRGYLAFLQSVEPMHLNRLMAKYGRSIDALISL